MSGPQKSSVHFSLLDIDADILVEKEEVNERIVKSRAQTRRSAAKKKQSKNVINPDESPLEFDKAFDFFYQGMEHAAKCYFEKLKIIEGLDELVSTKSTAAKKDAAEIAKLKKEIKDLKTNTAKMIANAQSKIDEERETLLTNIKRDVSVAILKARILMASEATTKGLDATIWDVQAWKDRLAILIGEDPDAGAHLDEEECQGTQNISISTGQ